MARTIAVAQHPETQPLWAACSG